MIVVIRAQGLHQHGLQCQLAFGEDLRLEVMLDVGPSLLAGQPPDPGDELLVDTLRCRAQWQSETNMLPVHASTDNRQDTLVVRLVAQDTRTALMVFFVTLCLMVVFITRCF